MPGQLAPILERILQRSGASLNSAYRGADAEPLLHKLGKSSQRELYEGYINRRPGFNPANPPGRSTHELRNDGAAYPGPRGMPLRWWQCGLDVSNATAVVREAANEGYTCTVTYPSNPREGHHVNFRKQPALRLPPLKLGSKGPRVARATRWLKTLGYLPKAHWHYDQEVKAAVRRFQQQHHQKADGVWGLQTARAVQASVRAHRRK